MEINKALDYTIKNGLLRKAGEVTPDDELLSRIIRRIQTGEIDGRHEIKNGAFKWGALKSAAIFVSVLIISTVLLFTFSEGTRAFAEEAFNGIKTLFVVEADKDGYTIVEKPVSEAPVIQSIGKDTTLSDKELSDKVGFNVSLPIRLSKGYKLLSKSDGIVLYKPIGYDIAQSLEDLCYKAVDDAEAFKSLEKYESGRFVNGIYESGKAVIAINIEKHKMDVFSPGIKVKKTKVNDMNAFWIEVPLAKYPFVIKGKGNDMRSYMDMTQRPRTVTRLHSLIWCSNDIQYTISLMDKSSLSMKETVDLAKLFMKEQKE